ncbi:MAG: hypothetical protein QY314_03095 [Candidatus Dojkabacteria bacterium]|nr:MAG: hypothetical protein QY314_03095 [Candidatus Dojkabacteria bacterium]
MKLLLIVVIIFLILWFTGQGSGREQQTTGDNGSGDGQSFTSGEVNNNNNQGLIPGLNVIREIIAPDLQFANQNQLFCSTNNITNTTIGGPNNYFNDAYITNVNADSLNIDPYTINSNGITNTNGGDIRLNNNTVISGGLSVTSGNISITGNLVNFPVNPAHFAISTGVLNLADPYATGAAYDYRFFPLNGTLDDISNVNAPSPTSGQALVWNGSAWVAQNVAAAITGSNGITVSGGTDVRLGGALNTPTTVTQAGNTMTFSGGAFVVSSGSNAITFNTGVGHQVNLNGYFSVRNNSGADSIVINGVEYFFPNADGASGDSLITDGSGNLAWGPASADATNGLHVDTGEVRLGGSLIENTYIDQDGYGLELSNGYFRVDAAYDNQNIDLFGYETLARGENYLRLYSNNVLEMTSVGSMYVDAFNLEMTTDDYLNIRSDNASINIEAPNGNVDVYSWDSINLEAGYYINSYSEYTDLYTVYDFNVTAGSGNLYLRSNNYDVEINAFNGGFYGNSQYMGLYADTGYMINSNNGSGQIQGFWGVEMYSDNGEVNIENYVQIEDYYITISGVTYYWPFSDGSSGQQLTTDGAGGLSWENAGGGGGGGGGVGGADNGLHMDGDLVYLGGYLVEHTDVNLDFDYRLNFVNGNVGFGNDLPVDPDERDRITVAEGGINVINPTEFRHLGDWGNGGDFQGIEYKDKYVYIRAPNYREIFIVDVSNKTNPQHIATWTLPDWEDNYEPMGLKVRGDYMYVLAINWTDEDLLYIVDIRSPSNPALMTTLTLNTFSDAGPGMKFGEMEISGDRIYVPSYVSSGSQIDVWNIVNPSQPRFCTTIGVNNRVDIAAIKVLGEKVYWSTSDWGDGEVGIAQVSSCGVGASSYTSGPGNRMYRGIDVTGRFLYATREDGNLDVFEVDDLNNINYYSSVFIGDLPRQIKIVGRYAYISTTDGGTMKIVDIRDPANPSWIDNVNIDDNWTDWVIDFEIVGDYMYAVRGLQALWIWDLRGGKFNTMSAGDLATDYLRVENYFSVTNDGRFGGNVSVDQDLSITGEARFNTRLVSGNCTTASLGIVLCDTFGTLRSHLNTISGGNSFMLDNVVVGDFSPLGSARLTAVHTTGLPMAVARATNGTLMGFYLGVSQEGSITVSGTTVSYNAFTGSHYAYIDTDPAETMEVGEVVRLTGNNKNLHNNAASEILYGVESSKYENDPRVLGAYLALQDPIEVESESNPHLVMATGNGVMWVEEGDGTNLQPGDYLISSQISGHAKLDPRSHSVSYVIARVAEPVDWSSVTQTVTEGLETKKRKLVSVFYESFARDNGIMIALSASGWAVTGEDKIQTGYSVIAPKIVSTVGEFSLLSAKAFTINEGNLVIDQDGNLTTVGSLTAPKGSIQELAVNSLKALGGGITVSLGNGESFAIVNNSNEVVLGVSSSGELRADKAAGTGTIAAGQTEVTIANSVAKSGSRIIVTPQGNARVYVKQKANGSFVVAVDSAGAAVDFDYLIVN